MSTSLAPHTPLREVPASERATLGDLHLAAERKHERQAVFKRRVAGQVHEVPDWRFHRNIIRLALYLRERLRIQVGDTIALSGPPSVEWVLADWAAIVCGAAAISIDPGSADLALASAFRQFAPRVAIADASSAERLLSLQGTAPTLQEIIVIDGPVSSERTISLSAALDLGGTLDTAERANTLRKQIRTIPPSSPALVHAHPGNALASAWNVMTHEDVVDFIRARREQHPRRKGDVAYVPGAPLSIGGRLALYDFVSDGATCTAFASGESAHHEVELFAPTWIVSEDGASESRAPSLPAKESKRASAIGSWLRRVSTRMDHLAAYAKSAKRGIDKALGRSRTRRPQ